MHARARVRREPRERLPASHREAPADPAAALLAAQGKFGNRAVARRLASRARLQRAFDAVPAECPVPGAELAGEDAPPQPDADGRSYYQGDPWKAGDLFYVPIVTGVNDLSGTPPEARWARVGADSMTQAVLDADGATLFDATGFGSEEKMIDWLDHLLDMTPDDRAKLDKLETELLAGFRTFSKVSIVEDLPYFEGVVSSLEHRDNPQQRSSAPKKSWKSAQTATAANQIVAANKHAIFPGGHHTIHHKLAQSKIEKLMDACEEEPVAAVPVTKFIDKVIATRGGATSRRKAMLNLPPNLEVGPPGDLRINDPGAEIDVNRTKSGTVTPRSEALRRADAEIGKPRIDFAEVARLLQAALDAHGKEVLTTPLFHQWKSRPGGKFERNA
jgi:hypothetical protein